MKWIAFLGRHTIARLGAVSYLVAVAWTVLVAAVQVRHWPRPVRNVLARQILFTGYEATRFVSLIALLVGLSVVLQAQMFLRKLGQSELLGPILVMVLIRELGPLITNFVVIGRSGTAMATGPPPNTLGSRSGNSSNSEGSHRYSLPSVCWPESASTLPRPSRILICALLRKAEVRANSCKAVWLTRGCIKGMAWRATASALACKYSVSWLATCWRINDSASTPIRLTVSRVTRTKLATRRQRMEWNMGGMTG